MHIHQVTYAYQSQPQEKQLRKQSKAPGAAPLLRLEHSDWTPEARSPGMTATLAGILPHLHFPHLEI